MSDFTTDQRQPPRRGSLLDHAGGVHSAPANPRAEAPAVASRADRAPARPQAPASRPVPSLLAAPARSARLPTAPHARDRTGHADQSAGEALPTGQTRPDPVRTGHQAPGLAPSGQPISAEGKTGGSKFGDRIARLIGRVPPEADPAASRAAPEDQTAPGSLQSDANDRAHQASPRHAADERQTAPRPHVPRPQDQGRDDHHEWYAAAPGALGDDGTRPLLDPSILILAVWRYRRRIVAGAVIGAVLGVLAALSTPHRYYAESRLFVDPREVQVTEDDIRNQQLSTEAMLAITDSQLQILSSTSVLEKVIADLGLDRDPEFNGSLPSGGISGGLALIKELFTGAGGPSDAEQKALENLRDSLEVSRDEKTFVIIIGVNSRDPEKSALIANQIVETYLDSEGQAQSSLLERTSESIDTRINALRADLDAAEREVERFKAENGLVGVGGKYIDDDVILALSEQLANARAVKVGVQVKANNLTRVNIDDVLSGAFPEELLSSNLSELRKQFTETRSNAEALATSLGPRHPRYIAARSSMDTIRNEISAELRRIVASSQTELQRAVETEQELNNQMAVAKSRAMDQSVEFVTLRELERKAAATRGIYEAFLTRSRETSERSNFTTRNVRVISPAEAPLKPTGPSRKLIAIAGLFAGFSAGLGLALVAGAVESIRAYNSGPVQARFQTPPFGGYPGAPDPAPRAPSPGSARRSWSGDADESGAFDLAADQAMAAAFAAPRAASEPSPAAGPREPASHPAPAAHDAAAPGNRQPATEHRQVAEAQNEASPMSQQYTPAYGQPAPDTGGFRPAGPAWVAVGHAPHPGVSHHAAALPGFDPSRQAAQGYAQPHPSALPPQMMPAQQAPLHYPAPYPSAPDPYGYDARGHYPHGHDPRAHDPRSGQPLWTAYPAPVHAEMPLQPHYQPQLQPHFQPQPQLQPHYHPQLPPHQPQAHPAYPPQPSAPSAPYPAFPQAPQPGYAVNQPVYVQPQPVYAAPQPVPPVPQAQVAPFWPMAAPPMHAPAAPQMPSASYQAAPQMPAAPYQAAPAAAVSQPQAAPQPVRNEAVDRIRREMDELRSRIDGYGASRRRA